MADDEETLYCDFCNDSDKTVNKLVAGPRANICDTCLNLAIECSDTQKDIFVSEQDVRRNKIRTDIQSAEAYTKHLKARAKEDKENLEQTWEHIYKRDRNYDKHVVLINLLNITQVAALLALVCYLIGFIGVQSAI